MRAGVIALTVLAAGCSSDEGTLAPVRGTVYYKGEPVRGGVIVFAPDGERGNSGPLACAEIQEDGRYVLKTEEQEGARPGWHRVTVAAIPPAVLPAHYRDPDLSGQWHEVRRGQDNTIDLHLD